VKEMHECELRQTCVTMFSVQCVGGLVGRQLLTHLDYRLMCSTSQRAHPIVLMEEKMREEEKRVDGEEAEAEPTTTLSQIKEEEPAGRATETEAAQHDPALVLASHDGDAVACVERCKRLSPEEISVNPQPQMVDWLTSSTHACTSSTAGFLARMLCFW